VSLESLASVSDDPLTATGLAADLTSDRNEDRRSCTTHHTEGAID
jgi:hypothetical protein